MMIHDLDMACWLLGRTAALRTQLPARCVALKEQ